MNRYFSQEKHRVRMHELVPNRQFSQKKHWVGLYEPSIRSKETKSEAARTVKRVNRTIESSCMNRHLSQQNRSVCMCVCVRACVRVSVCLSVCAWMCVWYFSCFFSSSFSRSTEHQHRNLRDRNLTNITLCAGVWRLLGRWRTWNQTERKAEKKVKIIGQESDEPSKLRIVSKCADSLSVACCL